MAVFSFCFPSRVQTGAIRHFHAGGDNTALIGRKDPSGKNGEVYDIVTAWWAQHPNQPARDYSWPAKPDAMPDAKPDCDPKVDPVLNPKDGGLAGAPYDDPFSLQSFQHLVKIGTACRKFQT